MCPTNAFTGPFQLDARKCISYLTIEHHGSIDPHLRPLMGNRIFGCDDCQLCAPGTSLHRPQTKETSSPRHGLADAELVELLLWDEETFLARTEGSAIRRIGYERWLRNLAVALGNAPAFRAGGGRATQRRDYPSRNWFRNTSTWAWQRTRR